MSTALRAKFAQPAPSDPTAQLFVEGARFFVSYLVDDGEVAVDLVQFGEVWMTTADALTPCLYGALQAALERHLKAEADYAAESLFYGRDWDLPILRAA